MNPEEKLLLERSLKLSEDNNRILKKMERRLRWAVVWGFIKLVIIIVPIIVGFIYLEPYFSKVEENYYDLRHLLSEIEFPL